MLKINILVALFVSFFSVEGCFAQNIGKGDPALLNDLMEKDLFFRPCLDNAGKYEVQIIYTQIKRDKLNVPHFTQYDYQLDNKKYFNPASLVKWPLILLGMEKINNLKPTFGVTLYNKIGFLENSDCSPHISIDRLARDKTPRLANYIKEMILVSDNDAYNRMYDFLGQEYINKRLAEVGYDSVRVMLRFDNCSVEQSRTTPAIRLHNKKGVAVYEQPAATNLAQLANPLGTIVKGGKDYSRFNRISLQDINDMILFTLFRKAAPGKMSFNLTDQDYRLLYKYTAMTPNKSEFPAFRKKHRKYPVHLKKYLYYGKNSKVAKLPGLEIHNMVGESHGTLADVAYFVNPKTGVEFMLSAVINTCDGDITPANYHYKDVGQPFMARLGRMIYKYELQRRKR